MIYHCPAWNIPKIVNTGNIHEIIQTQLIFGELAHIANSLCVRNFQGNFATKLDGFGDDITEFGLDFVGVFEG